VVGGTTSTELHKKMVQGDSVIKRGTTQTSDEEKKTTNKSK